MRELREGLAGGRERGAALLGGLACTRSCWARGGGRALLGAEICPARASERSARIPSRCAADSAPAGPGSLAGESEQASVRQAGAQDPGGWKLCPQLLPSCPNRQAGKQAGSGGRAAPPSSTPPPKSPPPPHKAPLLAAPSAAEASRERAAASAKGCPGALGTLRFLPGRPFDGSWSEFPEKRLAAAEPPVSSRSRFPPPPESLPRGLKRWGGALPPAGWRRHLKGSSWGTADPPPRASLLTPRVKGQGPAAAAAAAVGPRPRRVWRASVWVGQRRGNPAGCPEGDPLADWEDFQCGVCFLLTGRGFSSEARRRRTLQPEEPRAPRAPETTLPDGDFNRGGGGSTF